jgi:hypothetical protein
MIIKVHECGKNCPFFLCEDRIKNINCRCFLNPTLTTAMWAVPGSKTFPKNCKLNSNKIIYVKMRSLPNENKA